MASSRSKQADDYWKQYCELFDSCDSTLKRGDLDQLRDIKYNCGPNRWFETIANTHDVAVSLVLDDERIAKAQFRRLLEQRGEIENVLGALDWMDTAKGRKTIRRRTIKRKTHDLGGIDDWRKWHQQHEWLYETLATFDRLFRPLLSSLKASNDGMARVESELSELAKSLEAEGYFEPANLEDDRERRLREIVQRSGQLEFRKRLIVAYDGHCAVTYCDAVPALEASHIMGYLGPESNRISNGLLLRADIHTLFDLDLIGIDPDLLKVVLSEQLQRTSYQEIHGVKLRVPDDASWHPSRKALRHRWSRFRTPRRR